MPLYLAGIRYFRARALFRQHDAMVEVLKSLIEASGEEQATAKHRTFNSTSEAIAPVPRKSALRRFH